MSQPAVPSETSRELVNLTDIDRPFSNDQLSDIGGFSDALELVESTGLTLVDSSKELGNGFIKTDNKEMLVGVPFVALMWSFHEGDFGDEPFTAIHLVTRDGGNEPPDDTQPPDDGSRPVGFDPPESYYRGYELTYWTSLARADLAGASRDELEQLRNAMYDGWMRPNRYDEQGNQTFGYRERREARQDYERLTDSLEERHFDSTGQDANAGFDWDSWREEYEAAQA